MDNFFIKSLENISRETSAEEINQLFQDLLEHLKIYLRLDYININVRIILKNEQKSEIIQIKRDFLNFGVNRNSNEILTIEVYNNNEKYWPIILLREAYYYFVPNALKNNALVKIIINQIVINDLEKFKPISKWIQLFKEYSIDSEFLIAQFDKLDKFFRMKGVVQSIDPTVFFFEYIKNNVLIIEEKKEGFYDVLFKEFLFKTSSSLNNNEMVETIRILIKLFYKVKTFKTLENYKKHFSEFKKNGYIETDLSLRKFTSNIKWLNKFSFVGPSYDIDTSTMGIIVISCVLKFHPFLEREKIDLIIKNMPFFYQSMSSEKNFAIEIFGWYIIPKIYLNDLSLFIENLMREGYIINNFSFGYHTKANRLNLNYFRDNYTSGKLINPEHRQYNQKYNIEYNIELSNSSQMKELSFLDFLIIDRIRNWSITGFSFEKRSEAIKLLKTDFSNENLSQLAMIKLIKENFALISLDEEFREDLLSFIEDNKEFGFFYIKELLNSVLYELRLIENILGKQSWITNINDFQKFIDENGIFFNIEDNLLFSRKQIYDRLFKDFLPLLFTNEKTYKNQKEKMSKYLGFFKVCNNLKIFDLKTIKKIITNKNLAKNIYSRKKSKIEKTFRRSYIQDISIKGIEKKLQAFFYEKPQLIKPKMVTTISVGSFAKYYLQILLFYTPEVLDIIEEIKDYFPRLLYSIGDSLFNQGKWLKIHIWLPNLRDSEKNDLISILFNKLKDYLISIQRYYFDGLFPAYSRKDFYDFEKMEFFYSKTLYKEYFIFVQNIIQRKLPYFHEKKGDLKGFFWNSINDLNRLVQQVEKRISYEQIDYDLQLLTELISLNSSLINSLLDIEGFKILKNSTFFKKYIKSIKFKPVFQKFGFNQYFLYIRPSNLEDFDFKLILSNNFQNIKYPASVDNFQTFFIKYIFPYRTPNTSYLNWMSKSKKNIDEYCLFFIKKIYQIFHFDYNISSSGWLLNANRFKSFMQKVLYDPNFKIQKLNIKEFNIGDQIDSVRYNFNSKEFNSLTQIYNWHSTDIKSVLGTKMFSKVNSITSLIEKKLIFPYLKMKNLGLYEKIYIIIPNTNKENIDKLVKIFNFFNFGFIYEIEGSYFIKGMEEEIGFNNGLFIKLYFPDIDLSSFFRLFDLLFQFLKIKKYLILNDMSDGKSLLNHIYGNLDFLKNYNPLKNLLYNEKDEKYMNTKLYNESFEPKYPELI